MDPLTHTLVGANLAATRLGEKSPLAVPAMILGANLPDIDAILYFTGHDDLALGFRRGWTHGVLAIAVLPLIQTAILLLVARLRGVQTSVRPLWLVALSFLAVLSHPTLDWLNTYGMRWLMPFDGRWSYGDAVFIMDPWLWLILGFGFLAGRRPTPAILTVFVLVTLLIARAVGRRSPDYLIVVGIVAASLLIALWWKRGPRVPMATAALLIAAGYIGARLLVNEVTERTVCRQLECQRVMAGPHPIDPTRWDVVAQVGDEYRYGWYSWLNRELTSSPDRLPMPEPSPEWDAARDHPSVRGFMTWVRYPWYEVERTATETRVLIHDARRAPRRRTRGGFGGAEVVLPPQIR